MKKVCGLFIVTVLFFCLNSIYPQGTQVQVPAKTSETSISSGGPSKANTITFSFKDADIRNVLRLIAVKANVNIVYGPDVTGIVNMELKDVPWEQALHLVLDLNGYAYQREGNVIKVLKKEDVAKEPLSTKVFTLNYANASEAVKSVEQMLSERGSIKTDARSNTVIVTDVPANINRIEKVLNLLDRRTPQVLIETKVVELKNTKAKDLGIKWTSLKSYEVGVSNLARNYSHTKTWNKNTKGTRSYLWKDGSDNTDTSGLSQSYTTQTQYGTGIPRTSSTTVVDSGGWFKRFKDDYSLDYTKTIDLSDAKTAILSANDFSIILSALQSDTDTELISNPRVVTANNEKARIEIVSEYPVPNYEFDTDTSSWSITGFDKEKIGVIFEVTPNISADGYITMKVEPEVSKLLDVVTFEAGGAVVEIPYIGRKKASAKLVIKSGDTLVIGGLIDEDKTNTITKVPLLGDIPILGRFFRHNDVDKVKKDVIFFITATIIDEKNKDKIYKSQVERFKKVQERYRRLFGEIPARSVDKGTKGGNRGYVTGRKKK